MQPSSKCLVYLCLVEVRFSIAEPTQKAAGAPTGTLLNDHNHSFTQGQCSNDMLVGLFMSGDTGTINCHCFCFFRLQIF